MANAEPKGTYVIEFTREQMLALLSAQMMAEYDMRNKIAVSHNPDRKRTYEENLRSFLDLGQALDAVRRAWG